MGNLHAPLAPSATDIEISSEDVAVSKAGPVLVTSSKEIHQDAESGASPQYAHTRPLPRNAHGVQYDPNFSHQSRQGPYSMSSMANSLPQDSYRGNQYPQGASQPYHQGTSPRMMQHMPQVPHYGPSTSMPMTQGFYAQQAPNMPQYYGGGHLPPSHAQASVHPRQNMSYYPNAMMMTHSQNPYYYHHTPQYGPNSMAPPGHFMPGSPTRVNDSRIAGQTSETPRSKQHQSNDQVDDSTDKRQNAVRGPPRKPRQSGHAIWVGNLPPQTDLMALVQHVCKATEGLESLFLISKSNCAFANFKDESTCVGAQQRLHDSKFQSVRLVSRLRKSTVAGATAPTGPSTPSTTLSASTEETSSNAPSDTAIPDTQQPIPSKSVKLGANVLQIDKFFVLKSLTSEDLELSVRTGIWATQSHNEETLNNAFKTADNVYLVFSANKSGEYFGYARMVSEINEDPEAAIEFAPKVQAAADIDLPKAIITEATEFTPRGKIIDDSARGTIFWEIERDEPDSGTDEESEVSSIKDTEIEEETTKTWGKPFSLEWLSTNRLPFYRARGLRNPWNSNREVKIARDGTELEPSVGRRLIGLFNRVHNSAHHGPPMRHQMGMMVPNYPHLRPY